MPLVYDTSHLSSIGGTCIMTETATSPRFHPPSSSRSAKPSSNPAGRSIKTSAPSARSTKTSTTPIAHAPHRPGSVGQIITPQFASARSAATPYHPASTSHEPSSPSYFGFPITTSDSAKSSFASPSTVRSTAAFSPTYLPHDQNPELDAFRRQSEGKAFNLGGLEHNFTSNQSLLRRTSSGTEQNGRTVSRGSTSHELTSAEIKSQALEPPANELSRSPKRMLSPRSMVFPDEGRRASPASFLDEEPEIRIRHRNSDAQPRFALPLDSAEVPTAATTKSRSETMPTANGTDIQLMTTAQHVVNLLESKLEDVLLLDLRVATQYARSHILGALNLCIPTTLLKRPSFNVQKLADTFKDDRQRRKFETWRTCSHIVVYDSASLVLKDAVVCLNTIKKFRSEGYEGTLYIIKGGIAEFGRSFPSYLATDENALQSDPAVTGVGSDGPEVAPVVGGCPMPSTDQPANPFFGNIRQNMDLIGGVGQMPLHHPDKETSSAENGFPEWLQTAADRRDHGEQVSMKFEQIERREKKRMEEALSGKVTWGNPTSHSPENGIQIAGLEKGNKNRYNNIWPFEHSRVKLEGVPSSGCDYFNANHIKAAWSNKRYISTQAPIPATFNDFWNVVWQQDVRVIVMLTAEKEGPQVKAHNYWSEKQYGALRLDLHSEKRASVEPARIRRHQRRATASKRLSTTSHSFAFPPVDDSDGKSDREQPYVVVRRFTLSHSKFPFEPMREITQLHYSSWPDFGAPTHPAHLLGLVEQTDVVSRAAERSSRPDIPAPPTPRPVLVHCSAGCGRTGTFCTVDSVIDMLKRQRIWTSKHPQSPQASAASTSMGLDSSQTLANGLSSPGESEHSGIVSPSSQMSLDGPDDANIVENEHWLAHTDRDLVEKTVEDFRHQRLSMVQSLRQFVLCYESIMEWLVQEGINEKIEMKAAA